MANLNEVTKKYFNFDKQSRPVALNKRHLVAESFDSKIGCESSIELPMSEQEYAFQNVLRPLFGKSSINFQGIGSHKDFKHLEHSNAIERHYIVTLFIDIKGSTRLNLLLDLDDAFYIKNRILQSAIDIVRSLDGHPHRLMGDALMAFFGGKGITKEEAIADAINACAMLRFIMTENVFPQLDSYIQTNSNLAVRVGIDFGDDNDVLWACYGFGSVTEVTAQGLNVDCAAKLQHKAKANHIMLGSNVTDYIDFPKQYLSVKTKSKNKETISIPYLEPNITDKAGSPINYKMYHLNHSDYIDLLPIPPSWKQSIQGSKIVDHPSINFYCETYENEQWKRYNSVSRFLDANLDIRFVIKVPTDLVNRHGGLTVVFSKKNNGKEAGGDTQVQSTTKYLYPKRGGVNGSPPPYSTIELPEGTLYRGLHTMGVEITSSSHKNVVLYSNVIGVYIRGNNTN